MRYILEHQKIFKCWEEFVNFKKIKDNNCLPKVIIESWQRSLIAKIDFQNFTATFEQPKVVRKIIQENQSIIEISKLYLNTIKPFLREFSGVFILSDKYGIVIEIIKENNDFKLPPYFQKGLNLSEDKFGTFATNLALKVKHATHVWASEHYVKEHHTWYSCSDIIRNEQQETIGTVTLIVPWNKKESHLLGMIGSIAGVIERQYIIEETLKENHILLNRQNKIIELIPNGLLVSNPDGQLRVANERTKQMFGIRSFSESLNLNSLIVSGFNLKKFLSKKQDINNKEVSLVLKTGKVLRCVMSAVIVQDEVQNSPECIILNMEPIESVKKLINKINASQAYFNFSDLVGKSEKFKKTLHEAKIAGRSNSNVLLLGESGTGKELFAQSIHNYGDRRHYPFIAINCGAIPRNLIESELFGYEGGAFTGSKKEGHPGKFELADKGTLFLDEIGDMPLEAQVQLLRVLETGSVTRIGGKYSKKIDVRIIAATNKDLWKLVEEKTFREDLFFRINVLDIRIPPLRERKEDIALLFDFFIEKNAFSLKKNITSVDKKVYFMLKQYDWAGNVRELENVAERAVNVAENTIITKTDLPSYLLNENRENTKNNNDLHKNKLKEEEKMLLLKILKEKKGNLRQTALKLGISRSTLYSKIKKYNINLKEIRK